MSIMYIKDLFLKKSMNEKWFRCILLKNKEMKRLQWEVIVYIVVLAEIPGVARVNWILQNDGLFGP